MKRNDSSLGDTVRSAEKKMTKGVIRWRLRRLGLPTPNEETLDRGSEQIVEEAHKIIKKRGKSILDELKQAQKAFLKAYRDEEETEKNK